VVAVIPGVFPVPPEAGTPRPFQLLVRLARETDVHLIAVVPQAPDAFRRFIESPALAGVFRSVSVYHRRVRVSPLAKLATLITRRPLFDQGFRDPAALVWANERSRELARLHGPVAFYAWALESLQYVPPELRAACVFDVVDAPCLALERRIAGDRALSPYERTKLRLALPNLRRFERAAFHAVGVVSLNSSSDIARVKRDLPDAPIVNVIDGGDTEYFDAAQVRDVVESPAEIVFFGNMSFPPNADAALHLAREVMPRVWSERPDAVLTLIGPEPPERLRRLDDGRRVFVTGFVDDVRPYLARATVIASPLRFGAGMKNKLQAGLAMGKAMVASPITCEGFDQLEHGVHALVADGAEPFARAILALLADPARRRALGEAGRALIRAHYGWDTAAGVLWANLRHLGSKTGTGAAPACAAARSTHARAESA
jgi:glycosyltransferase involved in cell wall biosynthesis